MRAQDGQRRPNDLQRAKEIGREIARDLFRTQFFEGAEKSVAGVVHDDIEPPKNFRRLCDHGFDLRRISNIERERAAGLRIASGEFCEPVRITRRGDDALAVS